LIGIQWRLSPLNAYPQTTAREIFPFIDLAVAEESEIKRGHYVFIIACKKDAPREGYLRVLSALEHLETEYEVLEHQAVVSTKEVSKLLSLRPTSMVKTVIFKSLKADHFFVTLIPPTQRVDTSKLACTVGLEKNDIILAPPDDVEREFGFPIGGVPPLGFDQSTRVQVFVDPILRLSSEEFMFMGIGDSTKTLKLSKQAFLRLTANYNEMPLTFEHGEAA
jgi:prolyl-tRNA editing enzyme YbaK/EbsC (Cys-tRNA(Pro) deacylase)